MKTFAEFRQRIIEGIEKGTPRVFRRRVNGEPVLPEQYVVRPLRPADTTAAAALDKRWFGEQAVPAKAIDTERSIGIFSPDGGLKGFATYEVLEDGTRPTDYVGNPPTYQEKVLFVKQFTTDTNYQIGNTQSDIQLLAAVEEEARKLGCHEVWEALAVNHPYSKEVRPDFDAYGFYESHGYKVDDDASLRWQSNTGEEFLCKLFRKEIH